jgi:hypothetical protein
VYIHHAEDCLESRTLARNLQVLQKGFLGDDWLRRLTILIVPNPSKSYERGELASSISRPASAFHAVCASGAQPVVSSLNAADVHHVLSARYAHMEPALLKIQTERRHPTDPYCLHLIQEHLGFSENNIAIVKSQLEDQETRIQSKYKGNITALESSLGDAQENLNQALEQLKQSEDALRACQIDETQLRQRLDQTQSEYGSLRSQLQLKENVELGGIVQTLKDLNRRIDDFGRSISAYMVDNYLQKAFGKDSESISTLNARHPLELKKLLGHIDGSSSLVESYSGKGMGVEGFFDYATRSLLCDYLCKNVFNPFHPGVEQSQSDLLLAIYHDVQRRGISFPSDVFRF